jgi:DDE superfamily endonuclease/Helix-turn-helix of DDE superfamily endonuclease
LISYARLFKRPLLFRSFTGLTVSEFDSIYIGIESKYNEHERRRRLSNRKKRQRDVGAGRPFKLKVKERFLMLLIYYRLYITFTLSGFLFDLDQSNVCRDLSILEPLVKECIPLPKKLYKRTRRRARTIDEVEENFPGFKAFIDTTEQEIPRPKNKRKRKSYYSSKKKKHTIKTQYMVNSEGLILLHKTGHKSGRKHDYDIYKHNHPITPVQVENVFDLGYMGVQNDYHTVKSVLPFRKKMNNDLSKEEKIYNKKHSQLRIIVEHAICRIKKFGIMGAKFRNRLRKYDNASDIVSGLLNFRVMQFNRMSL